MDVDMNSITGVPTLQDYYKYMTFNPVLVVIIIVIIIVYFILFGSLGGSQSVENGTNEGGVKILGIIVVSIFILLVLINGFNYFLNIDIVASVKNLFSKSPEIDIIVDQDTNGPPIGPDPSPDVPEIKYVEQVYNIPGNHYSYNDAKAICKAYGNRLANYKEIQKAYRDGADWCNYGWSDDQMALFPTQYSKWENLQKIKGHENDCGRPGINGGYIDNPNVKFGVNCFGYKPKITQEEAELMENTPLYPITQEEIDFEKRVNYWKTRIQNILVSPFNNKKWSRV
tara:strand:- start:166 stop:1017 length:852 start_codon:yes stop_codon:yes gene_type:complete